MNIPNGYNGWASSTSRIRWSYDRFVRRDFEQIRRSWYAFFFQLPWLPEMGMRADDWRGAIRALRGSGIDPYVHQ